MLIPAPVTPEVVLEPKVLVMSFEDDGPAGWAASGDVPTTAGPSHGTTNGYDEVVSEAGAFGIWTPPTLNGVRDEVSLGMSPNPDGVDQDNDDDVDALDYHTCRYHYFSVDSEANAGLDPGDIYVTDLTAVGQNRILALDDVVNIGLDEEEGEDEADIDAWEFCAISEAKYLELFGFPVTGSVLVGLFSVDQDDTDTLNVDESGGLNPNQIYVTDLIGHYVGLAEYGEDIDALTVPEPATLSLLVVGGLALLRRRK